MKVLNNSNIMYMENEVIKNQVLRESIDKWIEKIPRCQMVFDEFRSLFLAVDIVCSERKTEERYLKNFVFGVLVAIPLALAKNNTEYKQEAERLTEPALDEIRSYLKEKGYLKNKDKGVDNKDKGKDKNVGLISKDIRLSFLTEGELNSPMTERGFIQYAESKNKTSPTDEEVKMLLLMYEQEKRFYT